MTMTHYLRFLDESSGIAMLEATGMYRPTTEDDPGGPITATLDHALDIVGKIVKTPAVLDEEGSVITPETYLSGWHVNYIGELPEGWEQYVARPIHPVRVFAGNS